MLKALYNLKNILPLAKNSLLPAALFAIALMMFYVEENFEVVVVLTLHWLFYIFAFISLGVLVYFNKTKPLMFTLIILISYITINHLKRTLGAEYFNSPHYMNLCFAVPINLVIFCMLPQRKLFSKENIYILLIIFLQFSVFENISDRGVAIGHDLLSIAGFGLNDLALGLFIVGIIILLVLASMNGWILQSYLLFVFMEIMFGFIYSSNPTAVTIFFAFAAFIILLGLSYDIYYSTYKDVLTSLASRNSYIINSKHFPLKYSVGIICIDDYERLIKAFRRYELNALILMIANKICELERENPVYRYDEDEFVIVFKNESKNEAFDKIEKIRRAIAAAEFALSMRKNTVKLTVSCSVSDKKRSDGNPFEALVRARKVLEKTNKFSQNVTTKA